MDSPAVSSLTGSRSILVLQLRVLGFCLLQDQDVGSPFFERVRKSWNSIPPKPLFGPLSLMLVLPKPRVLVHNRQPCVRRPALGAASQPGSVRSIASKARPTASLACGELRAKRRKLGVRPSMCLYKTTPFAYVVASAMGNRIFF